MADTTNPTATVQRRPRLREAVAMGATQVIDSGCKALNSTAAIITGVATRVTLHNAGCYLDMVEDSNGNEVIVVNAINKVLEINKAL